jgi:hypothetical protein
MRAVSRGWQSTIFWLAMSAEKRPLEGTLEVV